MDLAQLHDLIRRAERLETIRSYALRFWYAVLSVPFFTWLYRGQYKDWVRVDFSEVPMPVLTITVIIGGLLLLLPMVVWWLLEQKQKTLNELCKDSAIAQPHWYIPMLLFWVYLISLSFEVLHAWVGWVVWGLMVIVSEWYFYKKRQVYAALLGKSGKLS